MYRALKYEKSIDAAIAFQIGAQPQPLIQNSAIHSDYSIRFPTNLLSPPLHCL